MKDHQQKVLELLDTSGARLHGLLAKLTLSDQATGDLMQELFLKLSQSRGFEKAKDPLPYAWRTAVNLAIDWRRSQKIKLQSLLPEYLPPPKGPSALEALVLKEDIQQVLDATFRLSPLAREAVILRYIEEASYQEIARRLDKKPQHIRSLCSKAMARLRIIVGQQKRCSCGKE